jgi:quinolinate synthase
MEIMTIKDEIKQLKEIKNAIIMAHYYAPAEVLELADYVGDSYYLAKTATETKAEVVVFAGVSFMGESVKILNPEKTVLMPDITADCPMAHMAEISKIEELKNTYEDLAVVCYINSTAKLKCHSDVCVTSSNAVKIVNNDGTTSFLPNQNIFLAALIVAVILAVVLLLIGFLSTNKNKESMQTETSNQ